MVTIQPCSIIKHLQIEPAQYADYEKLSRFHYQDMWFGPTRAIYKLIDTHPWRRLAADVVGVIVYGCPPANLAGRNEATGGVFCGLDRSTALSLLNERMLCIRRVIIEPRYRGLGLASKLVADTMPMTGAAMIEAVSVMGKIHPFFNRAGMQAFDIQPDVKTERMIAALKAVGIGKDLWHDGNAVHKAINQMDGQSREFVMEEIERFCQKFTNRRGMQHSSDRTRFVLSKLAAQGVYYLWHAAPK